MTNDFSFSTRLTVAKPIYHGYNEEMISLSFLSTSSASNQRDKVTKCLNIKFAEKKEFQLTDIIMQKYGKNLFTNGIY